MPKMQNTPDSDAFVTLLRGVLSPQNLHIGSDIPVSSLRDWSDERGGVPLALAQPRTTAQVSAVLALCHAHGQPVVPQGGMTGLAGGAVPSSGAVLLSLRNIADIEDLDVAAGLMTVGAGTPLQVIQDGATENGLMFGLDLGARGSCQIGGNIATNAGGNRVIRYGMTRDLVLGLEVVLADGTILPMMNKMPKNNAALDLKHLFIGSEGTLGIITRAVLRLHPGVAGANTALIGLAGFDAALKLLRHAQTALSGRVTAFEVMWNDYYRAVTTIGGVRAPLAADFPLYALIDMQGADPDAESPAFQAMLEQALESGWALDVLVAQSHSDVSDFWALRDDVSELQRAFSPMINFDISVPQAQIGDCVERIRADLAQKFPGLTNLYFGHIGDSNLHILVGPAPANDPDGRKVEACVYDVTRSFSGSISAEHGIGLHKKPWLSYSRSEAELSVLRRLKGTLDPTGILNPGKVLCCGDLVGNSGSNET